MDLDELVDRLSAENLFGYQPHGEEMSIRDFDLSQTMLIDFSKPTFWVAFVSFMFAPIYWNIVARFEYHTGVITKIFCGAKYLACYLLALSIFTLQLERDYMFSTALEDQLTFTEAANPLNQMFCYFLFSIGTLFVLSSFWRLGITGTYLGDYFGILMKEKVTGFPFNTLDNPMYVGSVINLVAASLWKGSPTGLLLAFWAHIVYYVVVKYFEGFVFFK